jgi:chemotaxis family two-component system sensor kinase Cph1
MADHWSSERRTDAEFQDLAYLIVHHLKEPARTIRIGAQMLIEAEKVQERNEEWVGPTAASCVDRILRAAARVDDLAGSIAQYADDLSNENEPLETTDAEAILRAVRQTLGKLIENSGATVTHGPLPGLECQPSRFARLLENLLRNAILYRSEQAPAVHVSAERINGSWLFSISDNGIGIEPSDLERIFDPLSRLKSVGYRGLGMGLTTCRRIVLQHGGRIWMESQAGAGSTVRFTLPSTASVFVPGAQVAIDSQTD